MDHNRVVAVDNGNDNDAVDDDVDDVDVDDDADADVDDVDAGREVSSEKETIEGSDSCSGDAVVGSCFIFLCSFSNDHRSSHFGSEKSSILRDVVEDHDDDVDDDDDGKGDGDDVDSEAAAKA